MFNILILCDFKGGTAQTIIDHCLSFEKYSKHRCFYMNPVGREFPSWLPLKFFDVIIIHYSIYTISEWYLDPTWITAIANSTCYRIMFIQDEYRRVNEFTNVMRRLRIHCLYTCVPAPEISKVYPTEKLPDVAKINTLTGYIPEQLNGKRPEFDKPRPLDVGYRGRSLGYWYGELGQEKRIIAEKFLHYSQGRGLICDISCREEDRIYGEAWIRFLKSCYCTLGTESGASVFDFTGEIEYNVKQYLKFHPDANFAEVREIYFKDQEYRIKLNQISPRAFEAIACGSCLVLFEGEYSEILEPDRHFIPLKKDFSNFAEVCRKIKDHEYTRKMAEIAYDEIVESGRYSYQTFIKNFDECLCIPKKVKGNLPKSPALGEAAGGGEKVPAVIRTFFFLSKAMLGRGMKVVYGGLKRINSLYFQRGVFTKIKEWNFTYEKVWVKTSDNIGLEIIGNELYLETNGEGDSIQILSKMKGFKRYGLYRIQVEYRFLDRTGSLQFGLRSGSGEDPLFWASGILAGKKNVETRQEVTFHAKGNSALLVLGNDNLPPLKIMIRRMEIMNSPAPLGRRLRLYGKDFFIKNARSFIGTTDQMFFLKKFLQIVRFISAQRHKGM